jgi:glycerophosphoryl diester phosphodiesterase
MAANPLRHPFFSSSRPLVFAHRGGAALRPENTIAAFDHAQALGADGIELDVHLSRDGVAVVHHDRTLERTTPLRGAIADHTAEQLEVGVVPRLAQVLARYPEARIIIELKVNGTELARAVVADVRAARAETRVCVGSFWLGVLRTVRAVAPELATSAAREEVRWALYRSWCRWPARDSAYSGYQVPERSGATRIVSPRFIGDAHRAGLGVQVWTVDGPADARRLLEWGADAIITNRPDLMVPIVRDEPSPRR